MAYVERRSRDRWRARYRGPDGRERSKTFARRIDAERFLAAMEHSKSIGAFVDPALGRVRLADWVHTWLQGAGPTVKPKTLASYESLLRSRVLPVFGHRRLSDIRPSDVQAWVGQMQTDGLSASRIRQAVIVLRSALDAAVQDNMLGRNPCVGVRLPKLTHNEAAYLEPHVVEAISFEMPKPYDLLVRLLGTLGLRWGEAVALRRRHVDLLRRRLRVEQSLSEVSGRFVFGATKSHSMRAIPLSPGLRVELERHLSDAVGTEADALLFRGPKGGPLRYRYFYMRLWRPALERMRLPSTGLHTLRHSAAARMISAGASPKAVQSIMGHRSAAFTLTVYGHLFDADLDDLAAKLDLPAASPRPALLRAGAQEKGK